MFVCFFTILAGMDKELFLDRVNVQHLDVDSRIGLSSHWPISRNGNVKDRSSLYHGVSPSECVDAEPAPARR